MTGRALSVVGLAAVSLAAALVTGRGHFYNLTYIWLGLLGLALLWSWLSMRGLAFSRNTQARRTQVGHVLSEEFELTNAAPLPKVWLAVEDQTEMPGYRATSLTGLGLLGASDRVGHTGTHIAGYLPGRGSVRWLVRTVCTSRGRYALGPTRVHAGDPFKLFPRAMEIPSQGHVVVLPAVVPIRDVPLRMGRRPGGEALRRRTHQVTPNAAGIRDYRPGDTLNRIHWKSSARRDELTVKEFEVDPLADVWIVLDGDEQVHFDVGDVEQGPISGSADPASFLPASTEEYAVTVAASLIVHFHELDRDVGLIAHGRTRHVFQPGRGQAHLQRLLETLAVMRLEGGLNLEEVLRVEGPQIPRDAAVLLISPDTSPRVLDVARDLGRLGRPPALILLESTSFGGPHGSRALYERCLNFGYPCALISAGVPLAQSIQFSTPPAAVPAG